MSRLARLEDRGTGAGRSEVSPRPAPLPICLTLRKRPPNMSRVLGVRLPAQLDVLHGDQAEVHGLTNRDDVGRTRRRGVL